MTLLNLELVSCRKEFTNKKSTSFSSGTTLDSKDDSRSLRSQKLFDFKTDCFLCGSNNESSEISRVKTSEVTRRANLYSVHFACHQNSLFARSAFWMTSYPVGTIMIQVKKFCFEVFIQQNLFGHTLYDIWNNHKRFL